MQTALIIIAILNVAALLIVLHNQRNLNIDFNRGLFGIEKLLNWSQGPVDAKRYPVDLTQGTLGYIEAIAERLVRLKDDVDEIRKDAAKRGDVEYGRYDGLRTQLLAVEGSFDSLEAKLHAAASDVVQTIEAKHNATIGKVDALQTALKEYIDLGCFARVDDFTSRIADMTKQLKQVEERFEAVQAELARRHEDVAGIQTGLGQLRDQLTTALSTTREDAAHIHEAADRASAAAQGITAAGATLPPVIERFGLVLEGLMEVEQRFDGVVTGIKEQGAAQDATRAVLRRLSQGMAADAEKMERAARAAAEAAGTQQAASARMNGTAAEIRQDMIRAGATVERLSDATKRLSDVIPRAVAALDEKSNAPAFQMAKWIADTATDAAAYAEQRSAAAVKQGHAVWDWQSKRDAARQYVQKLATMAGLVLTPEQVDTANAAVEAAVGKMNA